MQIQNNKINGAIFLRNTNNKNCVKSVISLEIISLEIVLRNLNISIEVYIIDAKHSYNDHFSAKSNSKKHWI